MIFATVLVTTFAVQFGLLRARLLSLSTAAYASFLLTVVLGLELDRHASVEASVAISLAFFIFLALGHRVGRRLRLQSLLLTEAVDRLVDNAWFRVVMQVWFVAYAFLPLFAIALSGQSIESLLSVWSTNQTSVRAQDWVDYVYEQGDISPVAALVRALDRQLGAFWYLSVGVAAALRSRLLYPVLVASCVVAFLVSGGTRTVIAQSLLLIGLVWLLTRISSGQKRRLSLGIVLLAGVSIVALLLTLNALMAARQGREVSGDIVDRLGRTLVQDVAYGGIGLGLTERSGPVTTDRVNEYVVGLLGQPIPRAIWPDKPIKDPNWSMTEAYFNADLRAIGNITLFTPLGEALYYFGYAGLVIVPLLYGFTVSALAGLYSSSKAFVGLLAQVYIWTMLGMRLTYWNVYTTLVSGSLVLLILLVVIARSSARPARRRGSAGRVPADASVSGHAPAGRATSDSLASASSGGETRRATIGE